MTIKQTIENAIIGKTIRIYYNEWGDGITTKNRGNLHVHRDIYNVTIDQDGVYILHFVQPIKLIDSTFKHSIHIIETDDIEIIN